MRRVVSALGAASSDQPAKLRLTACVCRNQQHTPQQTYHGVVSGDFVEICLMINKVSAVRKPFLEISKAEDILSFHI